MTEFIVPRSGVPLNVGGSQRNSFRRPGSFIQLTGSRGDTMLHCFTCSHCGLPQGIPEGKQLQDVSWGCRECGGIVCPRCGHKGTCSKTEEANFSFIRQVEASEARERFRASCGLTE